MSEKVKLRHRFRCLVDQTSKLIVWLAYDASDLLPPLADASLNYMRLSFETTVDIYTEYEKYTLYFVGGNEVVEVKTELDKSSPEFTKVQLLRAKTTALASIGYNIKNTYERLHYFDTKIIDAYRVAVNDAESDWVKFVSQEFNIDSNSAIKLMKFKITEYDSTVFKLETLRITSTNSIQFARTLEDVDDMYIKTLISLLRTAIAPLGTRSEISS